MRRGKRECNAETAAGIVNQGALESEVRPRGGRLIFMPPATAPKIDILKILPPRTSHEYWL